MQAALTDLSLNHRDTPSFAVCQRVLHKCHEIIFSDLSSANPTGPYSVSSLSPLLLLRRHKVKHHADPVFVGIGTMLAGVPGMPRLTAYMGEVAIEQGRAEEEQDGDRSAPGLPSEDDLAPAVVSSRPSLEEEEEDLPSSAEETKPSAMLMKGKLPPSNSALLQRRMTVAGAQTVPTLPLHLQARRKPRLADDALGQYDSNDNAAPSQSSPALTSALYSARTPLRSAINPADALLERYDNDAQTQLLRNHFCTSQASFRFK
jgi:phosphatidylinositol 4-kinase B